MKRGFSESLPLFNLNAGMGGKRVGFGSNTQTHNLSIMGIGSNGFKLLDLSDNGFGFGFKDLDLDPKRERG